MPTTGTAKFPYPNSGELPDGPAAFLALAQRMQLMGGGGIGYVADTTELGAFITNGDAFAGLHVYHAAADALVRYNGSAFKLAGVKKFADASARGAWTTAYSGLLEDGSLSDQLDTNTIYRYSGSVWVAVVEDTGWIVPTLGSGWSNFAAPYATTAYRRINGVVHLKGFVKGGTGGTMFTLPTGFRPTEQQTIVVSSALSTAILSVGAGTGIVSVAGYGSGGSNVNLQLNSSWVAEQ